MQKLKDRYGDVSVKDGDEEASSSESEEDEKAEEITAETERSFFLALAALKANDPKLYDRGVKLFPDETFADGGGKRKPKVKESVPLYPKDYQRNVLLERRGIFAEEEEEIDEACDLRNASDGTYVAEQNDIKKSFKEIVMSSDEEGGEEFLKKRVKSQEEQKQEELDYMEWLKGQKEKCDDKNLEENLKVLHDYWNDPKIDQGEKFLRDYLLNHKYKEDNDEDIPTYDEIVAEAEEFDEQDAEIIEKQDEFERKYNFRFEEPGADTIVTYPREIKDSVRRKDDSRKRKREIRKERKEREKKKRQEEIKMLKNLKKKEILDKIQKLKEVTGNTELPFKIDELDEDFDPRKHDQRMKELFDDSFYDADVDEAKPCFSDSDPDKNWGQWEEEPHSAAENSKPRSINDAVRRRHKKNQFDTKNQSLQEYLEEYYKLDYEDIIGDLPCRFKYRNVVPNDFGLSVEEIAAARDRELNAWVSLKKICQYRTEEEEKYDVQAYMKKAQDFRKKKKILSSIYNNEEESRSAIRSETAAQASYGKSYGGAKTVSNKRKRNEMRKLQQGWKNEKNGRQNKGKEEPDLIDQDPTRQKLKRVAHLVENLSDARLNAYGVNPKKLKYKMKHNNPFFKFRKE